MRKTATFVFFAIAALAACSGGGGGHGSLLPSNPGVPGPGATSSSKSGSAKMTFYIPPASKQSAKHRFYISSNTQAFGVLAVPQGSTQTPTPENVTLFPVATPSPCAAASGGGLSCTLTVTAPIGNDIFYVAAFANASPGPTSVPLSEYISGPVAVSLSPAPNATPLAFSLNAVVNDVVISVPSPDPSNTPNTQVFVAASPTSAPLAMTAYDSSGNIVMNNPTDTYATPIDVSASPGAAGISLSLASTSTCGSSASSGTVSIECGADLGNVLVTYDGSTHPDSTDHVIDAVQILSDMQPSPAPSPATFVLASNIVTSLITNTYLSGGGLQNLGNGTLLYVLNEGGSGVAGTFSTSTGTASAPQTLSGVSIPDAVALAPNQTVWMIDSESTIDCWNNGAAVASGSTPAVSGITPQISNGDGYDPMQIFGLAVDTNNNVWFSGYDYNTDASYLGFFPASSGCTSPASFSFVQLNGGDYDETSPWLRASPTGGVVFQPEQPFGIYVATTANAGGSVSAAPPALSGSPSGDGVAVASNGTVYAAFNNSTTSDVETSPVLSPTLALLLDLNPTDNNPSYALPYGLNEFSPSGGAADRLSFPEANYETLGIVDNLATGPQSKMITLPSATAVYATAYGPNGALYALYADSNQDVSIARVILTHTWNLPTGLASTPICSTNNLLSVDERQATDSFTFTFPSGGSTTLLTGTNADFLISLPTSGTPYPVTVTDQHGRSITTTVNVLPYCAG